MHRGHSICTIGYNPESIHEQLVQEVKDRHFDGYENLTTTQLYTLLLIPAYIPSNVWVTSCNSIKKETQNTEADKIASYSAFSLQELRDIAYKNGFSGYMTLHRHELLKLLLKSNVNLFY
jgi:hypothetical protein